MPRRPPRLDDRRIGTRAPLPRIWVLCEGRNTEPDYLEAFARDHSNARVDVKPIRAQGVPATIVRRAILKKRELARDPLAAKDEVWAAFDCDTHPGLTEAISSAEHAGINIAFSNPCFELWALLHLVDHTRALSSREMQRALKKEMPSYDHASTARLDYLGMKSGFEDACVRAERMVARREAEGDDRGNPYTTAFKLTRRIAALGDPQKEAARAKADRMRRGK